MFQASPYLQISKKQQTKIWSMSKCHPKSNFTALRKNQSFSHHKHVVKKYKRTAKPVWNQETDQTEAERCSTKRVLNHDLADVLISV